MSPLDQLLLSTKYGVYVCSLANDVGRERRLVTRDKRKIRAFVEKWDVAGRGLYFCTSTVRGDHRSKDTTAECRFLHADIDFKNFSIGIADVAQRLKSCALPPSTLVHSGHGMHAYWFFDKTTKATDEIDEMLKRLAVVVSGDKAVTHRAALLRLPGSHNTKNGEWKDVLDFTVTRKPYSVKKIASWLDTTQPLFRSSDMCHQNRFDAFINYGTAHRTRIDVVERLNGMEYHGTGENSVHLTQLSCVASLASRGYDEDDTIDLVLTDTRRAAGGLRWNWALEERKLRKMYRSWINKKEALS